MHMPSLEYAMMSFLWGGIGCLLIFIRRANPKPVSLDEEGCWFVVVVVSILFIGIGVHQLYSIGALR